MSLADQGEKRVSVPLKQLSHAPTSYLERLRAELDEIHSEMDKLLDQSAIRYFNPNTADSAIFIVGAADWGWAPSDGSTTAARMRLLGCYRAWFDRFKLLFPNPTPEVTKQITALDEFVRRWSERATKWDRSIPRTVDAAKEVASKQFAAFDELLDLAAKAGTATLRLVPDTNALLRNPDLASYAPVIGSLTFVVHLLPTVLSELDHLKDRGRTSELRDRAQAVVRRLKGLRDKGSLAAGVTLTKAITVQAEAREVEVRTVLDWLDPLVPDDRIVAATLRLQSDHPGSNVVLVTSDLNLQNKADAVGLSYIETPPHPDTQRANLIASIRWANENAPPLVSLTNNGPAIARTLRYSVGTPPAGGGAHFHSGPWEVARLRPGESDEHDVWGLFPPSVMVTVSWTDGLGANELSRMVDFPVRPVAPLRLGRAR